MTAWIDGNAVSDRAALHAALAQQLRLPEWYGGNLDALWDCLTDLHEETEIRIVNPAALNAHLGAYCSIFLRVLQDAAAENSNITVSIEHSVD